MALPSGGLLRSRMEVGSDTRRGAYADAGESSTSQVRWDVVTMGRARCVKSARPGQRGLNSTRAGLGCTRFHCHLQRWESVAAWQPGPRVTPRGTD